MQLRTPTDFGLVIRSRRRELGMSQQALSEQVGVSRQWIVEVEKGKPRAEIGLLLRTMRVLDLQIVAESPQRQQTTDPPPMVDIDIDAVIDRARGRKP
jgi:y4mF family transcriptional regulator